MHGEAEVLTAQIFHGGTSKKIDAAIKEIKSIVYPR
jgi:hypothetical protein